MSNIDQQYLIAYFILQFLTIYGYDNDKLILMNILKTVYVQNTPLDQNAINNPQHGYQKRIITK